MVVSNQSKSYRWVNSMQRLHKRSLMNMVGVEALDKRLLYQHQFCVTGRKREEKKTRYAFLRQIYDAPTSPDEQTETHREWNRDI